MAYLTTGLDLKVDGLRLAGEPTDGSSDYDALAYEWLTMAERAVVAGGTFPPGGQPQLSPENWYWARAWPRGVIQLQQPYNQGLSIVANFTAGSRTVFVVGGAPFPDLTGFRINRSDTPARHIIAAVDNTVVGAPSILLREPWTGATVSDAQWLAYPDTYQLPDDFVRGLSPLFLYSFPSNIPSTQIIDVIEPVDLERQYPQTFPWGGNAAATTTGSGNPVLAARVTDQLVRFSHFVNTPQNPFPVQCEFEYLRRPPIIAEGAIPLVPIEHRRILSYGLAYLILNDKKSSDDATKLAMFTATYDAMKAEHARDMRMMSSRWGVLQPPRAAGNRAIVLTETGLPIYVW